MSLEQQRVVESLWASDGVCVCGRPIRVDDAKLCMAQINSSWCVLPMVRNTLAIGIYCGACSDIINMCLKNLKPLPEPDKIKHHTLSGA